MKPTVDIVENGKVLVRIYAFNPNHDEKGQFSEGSGGTSHAFTKLGKTVTTSATATVRADKRSADIKVSVNGKESTIKDTDVRPNKDSPTGYTMDVGRGEIANEFSPGTTRDINLSISKDDYDSIHSTADKAIQQRVDQESSKDIQGWSYQYGVDTGNLYVRPEGVDRVYHDDAAKSLGDVNDLSMDQKTALGTELNSVSQSAGERYTVTNDQFNTALEHAQNYVSPSQAKDTANLADKTDLAKTTGSDQMVSTVLVDAKGDEDLPAVEKWVKPDGSTYTKRVDYH